MKSLDVKKKEKNELLASAMQLMKDGDVEQGAEMLVGYWESVAEELQEAQRDFVASNDQRILAERGVRTLTAEENQFYGDLIGALEGTDYVQAVTGMNLTIPTTIMEDVFASLKGSYPILNYIDLLYLPENVKFVYNTASRDKAQWGAVGATISKEITGALASIDVGKDQLTAFIYVSRPMLKLGAAWLDRYVRTLLEDSLSYGLEDGFVNGTGKDQPVGMIRDLDEAINPSTGYAAKSATALNSFSVANLGAVLATLRTDASGRDRSIGVPFFAYNPADEVKVTKARKVLGSNGYIDVVPYAIDFIECQSVAQGKAIIGIKGRYLGTLASPSEGQIQTSDEYKFLEQNRTYAIALLGNGTPKDNTSFAYVDITNLEPFVPEVRNVAVQTDPDTKVQILSLVQKNGTSGSANTTAIEINFDKDVTGLKASNITLADGTGAATKSALTGSGKKWTLAITATTEGTVSLAFSGLLGYEFPPIPAFVTIFKAAAGGGT